MALSLMAYEGIAASSVIRELRTLGARLKGMRVVHVNSTREGGGVAEIPSTARTWKPRKRACSR